MNTNYRYAQLISGQTRYHPGVCSGELADKNQNTELRGRTVALVEVLEERKFEPTLEFVDASETQREIVASGHVALYDFQIYHDEATLRSESKATIEENAKVLEQDAAMQL